jgi:hypothetical protein
MAQLPSNDSTKNDSIAQFLCIIHLPLHPNPFHIEVS